MRRMKLSDIKITFEFAESTPTEAKMQQCRENWNQWHRQDRYLVVMPHNNVLIDGYIQYLVLKENGVEEAEVKISTRRKKRWIRKNTKDWATPRYKDNPTTYIYGTHLNSNCKKEFVWRVPESWISWADNIQISDIIMCSTKFGCAPIVVNKIEVLDKPPINLPIKKVCNKQITRNGMIVEI